MGISDWFRRRKPHGPTEVGVSAGGSRLIKYGGEASKPQIGFTEDSMLELLEKREAAYRDLFGESDFVFHELIPLVPHLDVYRFPPTDRREFFTYVTGGMSDLPMASPASLGPEVQRVELVFYAADDKQEYPEMLRRLAHFPHDNHSWLYWGHTMPNGTPPEPVLGSQTLDTFLFMPSIVKPDSEMGDRLVWEDAPINLLWCVPISSAECALKLEKGMDAIYELFDANNHPFVFAGDRASYV